MCRAYSATICSGAARSCVGDGGFCHAGVVSGAFEGDGHVCAVDLDPFAVSVGGVCHDGDLVGDGAVVTDFGVGHGGGLGLEVEDDIPGRTVNVTVLRVVVRAVAVRECVLNVAVRVILGQRDAAAVPWMRLYRFRWSATPD